MSKDIIQKSIECLAKAKLETTYTVARDIILDELINLQEIEKEHRKLNGKLRKENQQLKELTKDKSYCENCEFKKDNVAIKERCEYLQRSCERKEEQMLDYRQDYMEQEDYKSRIDKAIEYINEICLCSDGYANYGDDLRPEHIVDILQGNEGE